MTASNPDKGGNHSLQHRLAKQVRHLRETRHWSQSDLAKRSGLHRTHVSLIEREGCSMSLDTLERLAHAFGVPATDLLGGNENPQRVRAWDMFDRTTRQLSASATPP